MAKPKTTHSAAKVLSMKWRLRYGMIRVPVWRMG